MFNIEKQYPTLMSEKLKSVQPIYTDRYNPIFKFKRFKRSLISKLMCKLNIHRYKLVHDFMYGYYYQCDCGKRKEIIK